MDADKPRNESDASDVPTLSAKESEANGFGPNFDWKNFEQTNKLQDQVEELQSQLAEKLDENDKLSEAVLTLTKELELAEAQDSTEVAKNLAKKNKEWRDLAQKKDAEVFRLKAEIKRLSAGGKPVMPKAKPKSKREEDAEMESLKSQVKEWKERYKSISMSHINYRKQMSDLKAQTAKAKKVLSMEIGDDKLVQELLDGKSDNKGNVPKWRGRAQQIQMLQSKIRELKKKAGSPGSTRSGGKAMSFQDRVEANVAKSAETRKFQEQLAKEKETAAKARDDADQMKRKYDAAKARKTVLEKNVRSMKEQLKVMLSKSDDDDKLIDELKNQLQKKNEQIGSIMAESKKPGSATMVNEKLKERERQLARQSQKIAKLQIELNTIKNSNQNGFKASVQEWDFTEKERQIQTLTHQNQKQAEIIKLFNTTMGDLKTKLAHSEKSRDELSRKMETLKKRLENRRSIKPVSKDQIVALNQKIEEKDHELIRLKTEYARDLEHQQQELKLSRDLYVMRLIFVHAC